MEKSAVCLTKFSRQKNLRINCVDDRCYAAIADLGLACRTLASSAQPHWKLIVKEIMQ